MRRIPSALTAMALLLAATAGSAPEITEEVFTRNPRVGTEAIDAGRTSSGVYYEILREGSGPRPHSSNTVRVHYIGAFEDGREFDNSRARGQPLVIPLANTIEGWRDAIVLMPVGSIWKLHVPSRLAYGARGAGNVIPPNTDLVFEVELIRIER